MFQHFTTNLRCEVCDEIIEQQVRRVNFDSFLDGYCSNCGEFVVQASPVLEKFQSQWFTHLNLKVAYQSLINNLGRAGISRVAGSFGVAPFSCSKFNRHAQFLYSSMETHFTNAMQTAVRGIFQHYEEVNG